MVSESDLEWIEKYLRGECREEDAIRLEERMREEADFFIAVKKHQVILEGLDHLQLQEIRTRTSEFPRVRRWYSTRILGLAASLVIILGSIWWYFAITPSMDQLASQFYQLPALGSVRSNGDPASLFNQGVLFFATRDFERAKSIFNGITPEDNQYWFARYYLAHSMYQLEDYPGAQKEFQYLIESPDPAIKQAAEWNLQLCLLKMQKADYESMRRIAENHTHFYQQKATELLDELP